MRILMVAPQPFFSPRGTPFSVLNRCRALAALGHQVDLVTYHLGEDVDIPGVRIRRAPRVPGIRSVRIGPSLAKVPLDAVLFGFTVAQLASRRYDVLHTHEEAGAFGWWLHRLARTPHLYDMHSDLAQQLTNFGFGARHPLTRFAAWLERRIVRSAAVVIVICPELDRRAREYSPGCQPVLIENAPMDPDPDPSVVARRRAELAPHGERLIAYTGTLEPYQGVGLLVEAFAHLKRSASGQHARLLVAGGRPQQVEALRALAERRGVAGEVTFMGSLPPGEIPALLGSADVLISPRVSGTNTPLKVYAYLRSGRPIVATRILSHTQVLDATVAELVDPGPDAIAAGLARVLDDPELAARLGSAARRLAEERYNTRAFLRHTVEALRRLDAGPTRTVSINEAAQALEGA